MRRPFLLPSILVALSLLVCAALFSLTPADVRQFTEVTLQARAWLLHASEIHTGADYTLADPIGTITGVESAVGSCTNANGPYRIYFAPTNASGIANLSAASPDITTTAASKRINVTRSGSLPSGSTGWLIYWSRNGSGESHSIKRLCGTGVLQGQVIATGTTTGSCLCGIGTVHSGTNGTGWRGPFSTSAATPFTIFLGQTSGNGTDVGTLSEPARMRLSSNFPELSVDAGSTWYNAMFQNPRDVHVCTIGCDFATPQPAIDSIIDAADNKRQSVIVHPGDYAGSVHLKSYVSLIGTDRASVRLDRVYFDQDATESTVQNLTALSIGRFEVTNTVPTVIRSLGNNIGVNSGSWGSSPGDERALWCQNKQTCYSVGDFLQGHLWGLAGLQDSTVYASGDLINVDGSQVSGSPSTTMAVTRDEGGSRIYVDGSNIQINSSSSSQTVGGIGCVLAPSPVASSNTSIIRLAHSSINLFQSNASATGDLSCVAVPTGTCAEANNIGAQLQLEQVDCWLNSASSGGTLRGVYFPSDADHANGGGWKVTWDGGSIHHTGGATFYDVDNQETGAGTSVTLSRVTHDGVYNGAGTINIRNSPLTNGVIRNTPQASPPSSCIQGDHYFDTSGADCTCTTAGTPGTWTNNNGVGSCA